MANKFIKSNLQHYYEEAVNTDICSNIIKEPDKSKSISEMTMIELRLMLERLRIEKEAQDVIRSIKRNSGERDSYEQPFKVDVSTPIDQLYHHGILGMKWGVRRYQNPDGTRTAAGKKRERQIQKSEDHTKSREAKSKATSGLSNEELRKLNERLQLEATYKNLTAEKIQKSESFVNKAIKDGGQQALTEFSKGLFLGSAKLLVKEVSPQLAEAGFKIKEKKD